MGILFNRNHRLLVRIGLVRTLNDKINDPEQPQDVKDQAQQVLDDPAKFDQLHWAVMDQIKTDPKASEALAGPASSPGGPAHPILAWLAQNWHVIYDIVRTILIAFGIPLPPLPNIPIPVPSAPPTVPSPAKPVVESLPHSLDADGKPLPQPGT